MNDLKNIIQEWTTEMENNRRMHTSPYDGGEWSELLKGIYKQMREESLK